MRQLIIVLLFALSALGFQRQQDVIATAFKTGNATVIMENSDAQLDLSINGKEKVYSHEQAELVLKEFFKNHKPSNFVLDHKGETESTTYQIGTLTCGSTKYRVTYYTRKRGEKMVIDQIRIDKQTGDDN